MVVSYGTVIPLKIKSLRRGRQPEIVEEVKLARD